MTAKYLPLAPTGSFDQGLIFDAHVAMSHPSPNSLESSLPIGKYYPSVYEQRHRYQYYRRPASQPDTRNAPFQSATHTSCGVAEIEPRHVTQLWRPTAQASLWPNNVQLLDSANIKTSLQRPASPNLPPQCNTGPVTPLELNDGRANYIDKWDNFPSTEKLTSPEGSMPQKVPDSLQPKSAR